MYWLQYVTRVKLHIPFVEPVGLSYFVGSVEAVTNTMSPRVPLTLS